MTAIPKPRPKLLTKREGKAAVAAIDRAERATCRQRSGGQCEILELYRYYTVDRGSYLGGTPHRCLRRALQNHHLKFGIGRRNKGPSILAAHRLDVCDKCHQEITNHVLVPVDGTQKEDAATVRYERAK